MARRAPVVLRHARASRDRHDGDGRRRDDLRGARSSRVGLGWDPDGRLLVVSMIDRRLLRLDGGATPRGRGPVRHRALALQRHGGERERPRVHRELRFRLHRARRAAEHEPRTGGARRDRDRSRRRSRLPERHGHHARRSHVDRRRVVRLPAHRVRHRCPTARCRTAACGHSSTAPPPTASASTPRARSGSPARCRTASCASPRAARCSTRWRSGDRNAYACMLGGDDRRTLFVCTAESSNPAKTVPKMAGRIEKTRVDVPGAGLP